MTEPSHSQLSPVFRKWADQCRRMKLNKKHSQWLFFEMMTKDQNVKGPQRSQGSPQGQSYGQELRSSGQELKSSGQEFKTQVDQSDSEGSSDRIPRRIIAEVLSALSGGARIELGFDDQAQRKTYWIEKLDLIDVGIEDSYGDAKKPTSLNGLTSLIETGKQLFYKIQASRATHSHTDELLMFRDVNRTRQEMAAFQSEVSKAELFSVLHAFHSTALLPYVQGMNEVAAVLLYVLQDPSLAVRALGRLVERGLWLFFGYTDMMISTCPAISERTLFPIKLNDWFVSETFLELHEFDKHTAQFIMSSDVPLPAILCRYTSVCFSGDMLLPDLLQLWDVMVTMCYDKARMDFNPDLKDSTSGLTDLSANPLSSPTGFEEWPLVGFLRSASISYISMSVRSLTNDLIPASIPQNDLVEVLTSFGKQPEFDVWKFIEHLTCVLATHEVCISSSRV